MSTLSTWSPDGLAIHIFVIIIAMSLIIVGWAMVLRIQREKKLSELRITYMRLSGEEQNAYQRYIQAEKALQEVEIGLHKSKEIIVELKIKVKQRKKQLRELIEQLRLVKSKINLLSGSSSKLDLELEETKLVSETRNLLMFNNEDKIRINAELDKISDKKTDLPFLTKESAELGESWEKARQQLELVENEFRSLDANAWKKFAESHLKSRTQENRLDPERELVNMILLLNNKKGLLYVRKKEMAKDPTTESAKLVKKYEDDIRKLEMQLVHKSKSLGVHVKRLNELKDLFLK